ncbi:MAG: PAS domain S-box protein [Cyclobacteriaceae bacterium]|nr:PAS domain S-box protein [Cyclobacteriaceae bacterium]MCH8515996.1 PAS domain S-box protein [Cyclobacteriaceae bacterium]
MKTPDLPKNEKERLIDLESYQLQELAEKEDFDFLTLTASRIFETKISLISLITEDKQLFLSHYGISIKEIPKEISFCAHAINTPEKPLIIEDARKDERFHDNPHTIGVPYVVFYASVPLVSSVGHPLGTLCIIDDQPKKLSNQQVKELQKLARICTALFEKRKNTLDKDQLIAELNKKNKLLEETYKINKIGIWEHDITSGEVFWNECVYEIHELNKDFDPNQQQLISLYEEEYREKLSEAMENCSVKGLSFDLECLLKSARNTQKWVRITARKAGDKLIGSFQDITESKKQALKFKGIFNSTFSFIGFLDTKGILLEANDTAVSMAGLKHSDVIGKYFWDCYWWQISETTQEELKANFRKALAGETVEYEVTVWISDKLPVAILFTLKPVINEKGEVIYIIPEGRPVQELVSTRNRYKSVLEGSDVGTWEWNVQTGEVIVNQKWAEIIGYTVEELNPINIETWFNLTHPDDLKEAERRLNSCFSKEIEFYDFEIRLKHKQGHYVWVYDRGKVFEWTAEDKPLWMYGTHQNITERKNAEEELTKTKDFLLQTGQVAKVGGWEYDVLKDRLTWTQVTYDIHEISYDYSPSLKTGIEFYKKNHSRQRITDAFTIALKKGVPYDLELEIITSLGNEKWIRTIGEPLIEKGSCVKILGIFQDISNQKKAEKNLKEAISKLESVLDATRQISIIATDEKGYISLFNSGAETMLGYKAEEVIGKYLPELFHLQDELQKEQKIILEKHGKIVSEFETLILDARMDQPNIKEWSYVNKNGHHFPILLSMNKIVLDNATTGYLGVATDISKLKKVENDIRSLLKITEEQNERLKNFAYIVSHNLRSHATGISGMLALVKLEHPELFQNDYLKLLENGAQNLNKTIEDLTEVVKINLTTETFQEINLFASTEETIKSLSSQISDANIKIINEVPQNVSIQGISAYVNSIVLNMITNAIKYKSEEREAFLKIYLELSENNVSIIFQDNGLGIDLEKYGDKLFGLYKTFHRHQDARGVGLFITKNQVESMGGKITVESQVNKGTRFKVTLNHHWI